MEAHANGIQTGCPPLDYDGAHVCLPAQSASPVASNWEIRVFEVNARAIDRLPTTERDNGQHRIGPRVTNDCKQRQSLI